MEELGGPATGVPIGPTDKNVAAAVVGETHEYTDIYLGMARPAREEGFDEIPDWFETMAKAERSHAGRFQNALTDWRPNAPQVPFPATGCVGGETVIGLPEADQDRTSAEGMASSVRFVHFPFSVEQIAAFSSPRARRSCWGSVIRTTVT